MRWRRRRRRDLIWCCSRRGIEAGGRAGAPSTLFGLVVPTMLILRVSGRDDNSEPGLRFLRRLRTTGRFFPPRGCARLLRPVTALQAVVVEATIATVATEATVETTATEHLLAC